MNREIVLVGMEESGRDMLNQPVYKPTEITVFADVKSVGRSEYYAAATSDYRPSLIADVHKFEYSGEKKVKVDGINYTVSRTYEHVVDGLELIELTLSERTVDK